MLRDTHSPPPPSVHTRIRALPKRRLRGPVPCCTEHVGATIMTKEVMERWGRKESGAFGRKDERRNWKCNGGKEWSDTSSLHCNLRVWCYPWLPITALSGSMALKQPVSGFISITRVTTKGRPDIPGVGCSLRSCRDGPTPHWL